ncbi:MAG: hypothetical protein KA375_15780 [Vitreoscilla sp.]|nr:hypothetical protein [Vitreoscilla sp.]MBP6674526.1 hypothetical protein [Vitreoscilla sp.]
MIAAAAALAAVAIVTQDSAALRATPRDSGTTQAQLTAGDALEVRGERMDYLQVYDHRRERAGFVKASQVRLTNAKAADTNELLAVLRFVRDTPGQEALGVGYAAAYLKAAPANAITAEPFDALGSMAERLARRASSRNGSTDNKLAAHLEGVATYGVRILSYEQDGAVRLCYDGEAFRRVLAMKEATPEQRARAALGLTRHDCVDPTLRATELAAVNRWRGDVLQRITDADMSQLPEQLKNRLHLRRAGLQATLAFEQARRGEAAQAMGQSAVVELAAVNKAELSDDDQTEYSDAAIRVGASRWAAEPPINLAKSTANRPTLITQPGQPGETCVLLTDAQHDAAHPLLRRCTWGVAWLASAGTNATGTAVSLAVQPLATWRELWLMKRTSEGWRLDVLPPAAGNPLGADTGYVEFAGWVPEGEPRVLLARESKVEGKLSRRFEVSKLADCAIDKQASTPQLLAMFQRWQDPAWKHQSVSLR